MNLTITNEQQRKIKLCEQATNVQFEGNSFEDAQLFIKQYFIYTFYISGLPNNEIDSISEYQYKTINFIEKNLNLKFEGNTGKEANLFIEKNTDIVLKNLCDKFFKK